MKDFRAYLIRPNTYDPLISDGSIAWKAKDENGNVWARVLKIPAENFDEFLEQTSENIKLFVSRSPLRGSN